VNPDIAEVDDVHHAERDGTAGLKAPPEMPPTAKAPTVTVTADGETVEGVTSVPRAVAR